MDLTTAMRILQQNNTTCKLTNDSLSDSTTQNQGKYIPIVKKIYITLNILIKILGLFCVIFKKILKIIL